MQVRLYKAGALLLEAPAGLGVDNTPTGTQFHFGELEQTTAQLSTQIAEVDAMSDGLQQVLSVDDAPMAAAA